MSILELAQLAPDLATKYQTTQLPDIVSERVLYADADGWAYDCAKMDETYAENIQVLKCVIEQYRLLAGAEEIETHTTTGSKGGRYEIARLREYQGHRKGRDPEIQQRVRDLRAFLGEYTNGGRVTPKPQDDQEADDSVTQAMYAARFSSRAILYSPDKDLNMVPGLRVNPYTFEIERFDEGYGACRLDRTKSTTKVVGHGTSFFWHQMLMGDQADNIPGLPFFGTGITASDFPSAKLRTLQIEVRSGISKNGTRISASKLAEKQRQLVKERENIKLKQVGPVTAYEYLQDCRTDRSAFIAVRAAYIDYWSQFKTITAWDGTTEFSDPSSRMLEQARLLWMRRTKDEDVLTFFKELA